MTVLYLVIRYIGIPYSVINAFCNYAIGFADRCSEYSATISFPSNEYTHVQE
ncbi:hypothetical protein BDR03DRAFT_967850, partial [Suillus americanus]